MGKKPDDDVNNGPVNEAEKSEGKGEGDKEESEIAAVTQEDVTGAQGNDTEIETEEEEKPEDTEKSNDDDEEDEEEVEEEKSCETFEENLIGSGSESLESKSDDI